MTTELLTSAADSEDVALEQPVLAPAGLRPEPGVTVLTDAEVVGTLAGYLLRHGPAVALAPVAAVETLPTPGGFPPGGYVPMDLALLEQQRVAALERSIDATTRAGFEPWTVESYPVGGLRRRVHELSVMEPACVAVSTRSARETVKLARAARGPVLAVPPDPLPAGGPAVLEPDTIERTAPAAARSLATEDVVIAAAYDPLPEAMLLGALPSAALFGHHHRRLDEARAGELERAREAADDAARQAEAFGFRADWTPVPRGQSVLEVAQARQGILVLADTGGWRGPRQLREALRAGQIVLLVPKEVQ